MTLPLAVTAAAVPPLGFGATGPIHEFTLLSSVALMVVTVPPARLIVMFRLVLVTVLLACALTSTTPDVTWAPSSMKACVVVAALLSKRTPDTAPRPAAIEFPSSVEVEVEVA